MRSFFQKLVEEIPYFDSDYRLCEAAYYRRHLGPSFRVKMYMILPSTAHSPCVILHRFESLDVGSHHRVAINVGYLFSPSFLQTKIYLKNIAEILGIAENLLADAGIRNQ